MRWKPILPVTLILLVILLAGPALGQTSARRDWNNAYDPLTNGLGLHYGEIGGNGLSFRIPVRWYLYLQITGGIWDTPDDKKNNLGLQAHYILRQDDRLRLFLGAGVARFFHDEVVEETPAGKVWDHAVNVNLGAGVGLEYLLGPRWAAQVELNFAHTEDDGSTTVIPQAGIYFYW